jgi:hypothetical protein
MKKKLLLIGIILLLILLPIVYYLVSPLWKVVVVQEESPFQVDKNKGNISVLAQGLFKAGAHEVMGKALLIQTEDSKVLRFEDFETVNGPDLHIWLASSLSDEDYVDLGPIKATKGNVNYEVPADIDIKKYNKVLIWCVPFRILFSYAELE